MQISTRLILDVIDVLIVAFLFYRVLVLVRGTRAAQMVLGLAVLAILSVFAQLLNLSSMQWLFENLRTVWVIGFIILFQPELRRGLTQLGQRRLFKGFLSVSKSTGIGEIQRGLESMCNKRLGAIVVIERDVGLSSYIETGTHLEAKVTAELLETIFTPPSPLHDGAVVIRADLIVAAGCILPLSQNPLLERMHGMRHRAAVGLSEESDAIAIVASEETGQISVAEQGVLHRLKEPSELRAYLASLLQAEEVSAEEVAKPTPGEPFASREETQGS